MRNFTPSDFNSNDPDSVSVIDELPFWSAPFGLKLLDMIRIKPRMTVLDIGFGLGFPLIEAASRLGRTAKVYGIDPWEAATKRARKKISILGIENIELITGVAENIPLPDNSVDLIISNNGINNVQDIGKVFLECSRIAKPGAQFAATVNLPETMMEFYSIFMEVLRDLNMKEKIPWVKEHIHNKRLPVGELKELFTNNDFEIAEANVDSFRYRFVDGTAMFEYPSIRNFFMDSWLAIVPPENVNAVFSEIERRMNRISHEKGEWVLTIPFVTISAYKK